MPRRHRYEPLNVYVNGRKLGQLRREPSGAIEFEYDADWLAWPSAFPASLSLPLREDPYVGRPVLAVFDNLLPDNTVLRQRIATQTGAPGIDAYSLLSRIGRDCVGAMQFLPPDELPGPAGAVNGQKISQREIIELLSRLATAPLGMGRDERFRISIAGAQEKTALLFWDGHWYKPEGATATTHIFKPSIGQLPNGLNLTHSVENEYLCLRMLQALGVPAAKATMKTFGDRRVLIVERFDRRWTDNGRLLRLPQEDCCQALSVPPTLKYQSEGGPGVESILNLLKGSDDAIGDQRRFLKAVVVFWLIGATDGHAKNFSIFLLPRNRYQMAPLYDVLSAQPNVTARQIPHNKFKLAMSVGKNHYVVDRIAPRHFVESARAAGLGEKIVHSIFEELYDLAPVAVDQLLASLPKKFPDEVAGPIRSGLLKRLGALDVRSH
jgi:serine/threonine-protein kinase HipA